MDDSLRLAICGGGTGGHVIPAITICEKIKELKPDTEFVYIGAANSLEQRLAGESGYAFKPVWISSLRRGRFFSNISLPLKCAVSLVQAFLHLTFFKAHVVVGTGGFSSWPACAAARYSGRPYVLWEPNAFPGLVTRLLAKRAKRVYISFKEVSRKLKLRADQFLITGNPVSIRVGEVDPENARRAFNLDPDRTTILVTGGSGGARSINKVVDNCKESLIKKGLNIVWQTGKHWDGNLEVPEALKNNLFIQRFLNRDEMSLAYSAADFALTRCGSMTLAELAQAGLPAILVPFPFAAEGHQEANARAVVEAGGGRMILDQDLNPESLIENISDFLDVDKRKQMLMEMRKLARPDAAEIIANDILGLIS